MATHCESTEPVTLCSNEFPNRLITSVGSLFSADKLTDFTITTEVGPIKCHKVILAANSAIVLSMLTSSMAEVHKEEWVLDQYQHEVVEQVIKYMYTGNLTTAHHQIEEAIRVADYMQLKELKSELSNLAASWVARHDALHWLKFATIYSLDKLRKKSLEVVGANLAVISLSEEFSSLTDLEVGECVAWSSDPDEALSAALCWIQHDPGVRSENAAGILRNISLNECSKEAIRLVVDCLATPTHDGELSGRTLALYTMAVAALTSFPTALVPASSSSSPHPMDCANGRQWGENCRLFIAGGYIRGISSEGSPSVLGVVKRRYGRGPKVSCPTSENSHIWELRGDRFEHVTDLPPHDVHKHVCVCGTPSGLVVTGDGFYRARGFAGNWLIDDDDPVMIAPVFQLTGDDWCWNLPQMKVKRGHHRAVSHGDRIYVFGDQQKEVEYFSREQWAWNAAPSLPMCLVKPRPEIIYTADQRYTEIYLIDFNSVVYSIHTTSHRWYRRASPRFKFGFGLSCSDGRHIWAMGEKGDFAVYDSHDDVWRELPFVGENHVSGSLTYLPSTRSLWLMGGIDGRTGELNDHIVEYNIGCGEWHSVPILLPHKMYRYHAVIVGEDKPPESRSPEAPPSQHRSEASANLTQGSFNTPQSSNSTQERDSQNSALPPRGPLSQTVSNSTRFRGDIPHPQRGEVIPHESE
eukprot:GHVN01030310.1.p1 GENE.GHVN01030310.1~~GHVN01030310.1.p1  ORF type:complete len:693 (-),score=119.58 GHVN01030310.1:487-2565(-)